MSGYKKIRPSQGFKKGQVANPKGRPKLLPENHGVKKLSTEDLRRMITRFFNMTFEEMSRKVDDPAATTLELCIASCLNKAIETGDFTKIGVMIERVIGRVKDTVEVDPVQEYKEELKKVPPKDIVAYLRSKQETPTVIDAEASPT